MKPTSRPTMDPQQLLEYREGALHQQIQSWIAVDPIPAKDLLEVWELAKYTTDDPLIICDILAWYDVPATIAAALKNLIDFHLQPDQQRLRRQRNQGPSRVTEDFFHRAIYGRRERRVPFGQETIQREGQSSGLPHFHAFLPAKPSQSASAIYPRDEESILYVQSCFDIRMRRYRVAEAHFAARKPTVADFYAMYNFAKWMLEVRAWFAANVPGVLGQTHQPDWQTRWGPGTPPYDPDWWTRSTDWEDRALADWAQRWARMTRSLEVESWKIKYVNWRHLEYCRIQWFCPDTKDGSRVLEFRKPTLAEEETRMAVCGVLGPPFNPQDIDQLATLGEWSLFGLPIN